MSSTHVAPGRGEGASAATTERSIAEAGRLMTCELRRRAARSVEASR